MIYPISDLLKDTKEVEHLENLSILIQKHDCFGNRPMLEEAIQLTEPLQAKLILALFRRFKKWQETAYQPKSKE